MKIHIVIYTYRHVFIGTSVHIQIYAYTHACTHARTHARTHACMYGGLKEIGGLVPPRFWPREGRTKKPRSRAHKESAPTGRTRGAQGETPEGARTDACGRARAGLLCTKRGRTRKPRPWAHKGAQRAHKSLRVLVPGRGGFSNLPYEKGKGLLCFLVCLTRFVVVVVFSCCLSLLLLSLWQRFLGASHS